MIGLIEVKQDEELLDNIKDILRNDYVFSEKTKQDIVEQYSIRSGVLDYIFKNYPELRKDAGTRAKNSQRTKLKRYGSVNNMTKREATCLEKYGSSHHSSNPEVKANKKQRWIEKKEADPESYKSQCKEAAKKRKQSLDVDAFGVALRATRQARAEVDPLYNEKIQQKRKATCLSTLGVDNVSLSAEVALKKRETAETALSRFEQENDCTRFSKVIDLYGQCWVWEDFPILHFHRSRFLPNSYLPRVRELFDNRRQAISSIEKTVVDFIKSIYKGPLELNTRSVINPKELDIYIPEKKVAIEFNGSYWHSSEKKDKDYHSEKTRLCKEQGVRLIHIFDYIWMTKRSICCSILAAALGIYDQKIMARNCVIQSVNSKQYKDFLQENHIQGAVNSSTRLGLYCGTTLVQVVGFGLSRFEKNTVELHRMCTKKNTQVIGGFSKLVKHSAMNNFVSYIDTTYFSGEGYKALGFTEEGETAESYVYIKGYNSIISRYQAQKHKLEKLLDTFDSRLSEYENMRLNNYHKVFGCKNIKVRYIK